jgi:F-type H+-transporting ATPase subunit b
LSIKIEFEFVIGLCNNVNIPVFDLINLVIIIGVLYYFGGKFLGQTLSTRQSAIKTEISEAEQRKQQAAAALAEQQQKLAQAQREQVQRELDEQKSQAMAALEQQVHGLSRQILDKLLGSLAA